MKHNCKYCGKEYKNSHRNSSYCSRACRNKDNPIKYTNDRKKKHSIACKGINSGEKNGMYGKKGALNPAWLGGNKIVYPKEFNDKLKSEIKKRDCFVCQLCGLDGNNVHHIDYDVNNCKSNNLITLCSSCHGKTNYNRETWKEILIDKIKNYEKNI